MERDIPYYELSMMNKELKETYKVMDTVMWDEHEIDAFLGYKRRIE